MSDYDPDCLQSNALGPFQTAPPEEKDKSTKRGNDKPSGPPPKVPKRESKAADQGQDLILFKQFHDSFTSVFLSCC